MVELNILDPNTPGFLNMGTTELLSVPFSFYSDISDSAKFSNGSGKYYFSATIPQQLLQVLPEGYENVYDIPLKFPRAIYNEGSHYDTVTSEFTAPDSGIYAFEVSISGSLIFSENYINLEFAIVKNSKAVRRIGFYIDEYEESNYYAIISGQVRLILKKGDKVSIRAANDGRVAFIGHNGYWDFDDPEQLEGFSNYELNAFAEFSGYKVK